MEGLIAFSLHTVHVTVMLVRFANKPSEDIDVIANLQYGAFNSGGKILSTRCSFSGNCTLHVRLLKTL